jgi:beta-glucosidase
VLGLGVAGQAGLYLDGKLVVQNSKDQKEGLLFVSRTSWL